MSTSRPITLTEEEDGWWTARDDTLRLTTQGETREAPHDSLDEVIDDVENGSGREPTDEELREWGIDPADNRPGRGELPPVLRGPDEET